jgi:hypothetical protein
MSSLVSEEPVPPPVFEDEDLQNVLMQIQYSLGQTSVMLLYYSRRFWGEGLRQLTLFP